MRLHLIVCTLPLALFMVFCEQREEKLNTSVIPRAAGQFVGTPAQRSAPPDTLRAGRLISKKAAFEKQKAVSEFPARISSAFSRKTVVAYHSDKPDPARHKSPEISVEFKKKRCGLREIIELKDPSAREYDPGNFSFYKVEHGIKHNSIRSLCRDSKGNLWIGTFGGGAGKFDGRFYTAFTKKQGLVNDLVTCVYEDSQGNIWFGSSGGVSMFDGSVFNTLTEAEGLPDNSVYSVCEDSLGGIWLGTGDGLCCLHEGKLRIYRKEQGLSHNTVYKVISDGKGKILCGTQDGISIFDGHQFSGLKTGSGPGSDVVLSLCLTDSGDLWFGTAHGVGYYAQGDYSSAILMEAATGMIGYAITQSNDGTIWVGTAEGLLKCGTDGHFLFGEKEGLSSSVIFALACDRADRLWLGTHGGGLVLHNGESFKYLTKESGFDDAAVLAIENEKDDRHWFGTLNGKVLFSDGRSFSGLTDAQDFFGVAVYDIFADRQGRIWFANDTKGVSYYKDHGLYRFDGPAEISQSTVYQMCEDKTGNIWFATEGSGVICYTGHNFIRYGAEQGLPSDVVYSLLPDKAGAIWFGTNKGVSRLQNGKFTNYSEADGLPDPIIFTIYEDARSRIWIGTNNGACCVHGTKFSVLNENNGLMSNAVLSFVEDDAGNLWLGTRKGISKLTDPALDSADPDNRFFNIGFHEGFRGVNCRKNSVCKNSEGRIWWGSDILTLFDPKKYQTDSTAPGVEFTTLRMYDETIPWGNFGNVLTDSTGSVHRSKQSRDTVLPNGVHLQNIEYSGVMPWSSFPRELSLPHSNNNLTIGFVGTSLQHGDQIRYRCKLEGLDANWSSLLSRNEMEYNNLSPGTYTFLVQAVNALGKWSAPAAFSFEVRPAWWTTWWFKTLVVIAIFVLVRFYIRWREQESKRVNEKLEVKNKELTKINAELDRFVYSASHELRGPLTSLLGLVHLAKTEETSAPQLEKFRMMENAINKLDRFTLDIIDYSRNSRMEMKIEKIDFRELLDESVAQLNYMPEMASIDLSTVIESEWPPYSDKKRVSILLNNLISNAVKYSGNGSNIPKIQVLISCTPQQIRLEVTDNGIGISPNYINRVFEMFFRATDTKSGAGLGLYICKEIVDHLGGEITVRSELRKFTTVTVILPNHSPETRETEYEPLTQNLVS